MNTTLTFNAKLGAPLLIQPVRVLDTIRLRTGKDAYVVRVMTPGEFYNKVVIIDPKDLMNLVEEEASKEAASGEPVH